MSQLIGAVGEVTNYQSPALAKTLGVGVVVNTSRNYPKKLENPRNGVTY